MQGVGYEGESWFIINGTGGPLVGCSEPEAKPEAKPKAKTEATTEVSAEPPPCDPVKKYGEESAASAKRVMEMVLVDNKITFEPPHYVVNMGMYIEDKNSLHSYVEAIFNAKSILNCYPSIMYFYDPSNKMVACADPGSGVILKD